MYSKRKIIGVTFTIVGVLLFLIIGFASIVLSSFLIVIGTIIFFNDSEDKIENIKDEVNKKWVLW